MDAGIAEQVVHDLSQPVRAPVSSTTSSSSEPSGWGKGVQVDRMACRGRASGLAALVGAAARFVTGFGALCRLPDITRWAQTVAALLAPEGSSTWPSTIPSPTPWPKSSPAGGVTGFLKKRAP
ncbi:MULTISPECIES: hypothetical protein [Streptomyces]|uniref:hypothetical protein n=1 Tax=Streptomyces TaxID=1883 RepID=UPI00287FC162|nr:hypothetical protein [Streptomyces sp. CGMCC 4.1456]WNF67121.1 hypothetical protein RJD14_33130 [Streptomyces sp. CGMCC 4.1456]